MGVKSTVTLTRVQAIEKAIELHSILHSNLYSDLTNIELEDRLERMNDMTASCGQGYENYSIRN